MKASFVPSRGDGREDMEAAPLSQRLDLAARPWLVGVQIEAPDVLASDQAGERQTPGACPRPTQSERRPFVLLGPRGEPRRGWSPGATASVVRLGGEMPISNR